VYFATDKAVITPAAAKTLLGDIDALKAHPGYVIAVEGNTDSRGSAKYNEALARRRLDAVEKFLKDHGVPNSLESVDNGESKPIADNKTAEGMAKNRRVDLDLVGGK
jgi:OOP family OmpA-OmpF porin